MIYKRFESRGGESRIDVLTLEGMTGDYHTNYLGIPTKGHVILETCRIRSTASIKPITLNQLLEYRHSMGQRACPPHI